MKNEANDNDNINKILKWRNINEKWRNGDDDENENEA